MKRSLLLACLSVALLLTASAQAGMVSINPTLGQKLDHAYAGVSFSAAFSSARGIDVSPTHGPTYSDGSVYGVTDPGNSSNVVFGWKSTLSGYQAGWAEQYMGLRIDFASPVSAVSLDMGSADLPCEVWLIAFNSAGQQVNEAHSNVSILPSADHWVSLTVQSAGDIAYVLAVGDYGFFKGEEDKQYCYEVLMDNLLFVGGGGDVVEVPEPASLFTLSGGLMLLGLAWYRRR